MRNWLTCLWRPTSPMICHLQAEDPGKQVVFLSLGHGWYKSQGQEKIMSQLTQADRRKRRPPVLDENVPLGCMWEL